MPNTTPDPSIIYLKIDSNHLVRTGFKNHFNELLDTAVFNAFLDDSSGTNMLILQREKGNIEIEFSLTGLPDVETTNLAEGDILSFNGTSWVNTSADLEYVRPDTSSRFPDISNFSSVTDALDKILYPYQPPSFTSFSIAGKSGTLEVGQSLIPSGGQAVTFNFGKSHVDNIDPVLGYAISDISGGSFSVSNILPISVNSYSDTIPYEITKTSNGASYGFKITGKNTQGNTLNRNVSYSWRTRMFWGTSSVSSALSSAQVISLPSSNTGGSALVTSKTRSFTMDGNGEYIWICHSKSLGSAIDADGGNSLFVVGGLANSAWERFEISFTNAYGFSSDYYLYRSSTVQFGTGIAIQIKS